MQTNSRLEALIPPLLDLAHQASHSLLRLYRSDDLHIDQKPDHTPVTSADIAANLIIQAGLKKLEPALPVLSEECCDFPFSIRKSWSQYWLIDPLDGTRQFIDGEGEFCINIALIEDHQPVLGLVFSPLDGTVYFGWKNGGAWRRNADSESTTALQSTQTNHEKIRVTSNHTRFRGAFADFLANIGEHQHIRMGSSLKSCLIAEGGADLYPRLGDTSEWDTAAPQIILEEAGGHIVDTHMQPLRYNTKDSLLNPHFFAAGNKNKDWSLYLPPAYPKDDSND